MSNSRPNEIPDKTAKSDAAWRGGLPPKRCRARRDFPDGRGTAGWHYCIDAVTLKLRLEDG